MEFTYLGLKAKLDRHAVTEEEVNHQLERLRQQSPRIAVITDRATQRGDEVVLDYAGFCHGEQFAGGTAEKQTLVLGSGTFIPGFEEQLLDKVPGEQVVVKVMFPSNYHAENLAGQAAEFRCTIHEIREKSVYELDDVFAQEVGRCENMEQLRQKLTESMQAYANERGEMDLQDQLLRQAAATLDIQITDEQLNEATEQQLQNMRAQLAQQGLSLEMYCSFMSTTEDAIREDLRPQAETSIRVQAAIEKIVELEKLEPTQEEIGQALAVICRQNQMTMDQLKQYYDAEFEAAVVRSVLTSKVMGLIRNAAQIEEI